VRENGSLPVPLKLRNATTDLQKEMGYAKAYKYPHNFTGNYVEEKYLPEELDGAVIYQPSDSGQEAEWKVRGNSQTDTKSADDEES
jgi:putative ATPase